MRRIGDTFYCSDGDWAGSLTARVEHDVDLISPDPFRTAACPTYRCSDAFP